MAILNSGTPFTLKMLSDSILYCSYFKSFRFQHYYSSMHLSQKKCCAIVRGVHHVLGCLYLPKLFHEQNASESHTYNLKEVYKISTGRKFYGEMSPNCSILATIFQNFPRGGGGACPQTPSSSMLCTPLPKRLDLEVAPPFINPRSAPGCNFCVFFTLWIFIMYDKS